MVFICALFFCFAVSGLGFRAELPMHALCMVCGPLPTYASAWPAYAAFGMRMHATTQKP